MHRSHLNSHPERDTVKSFCRIPKRANYLPQTCAKVTKTIKNLKLDPKKTPRKNNRPIHVFPRGEAPVALKSDQGHQTVLNGSTEIIIMQSLKDLA